VSIITVPSVFSWQYNPYERIHYTPVPGTRPIPSETDLSLLIPRSATGLGYFGHMSSTSDYIQYTRFISQLTGDAAQLPLGTQIITSRLWGSAGVLTWSKIINLDVIYKFVKASYKIVYRVCVQSRAHECLFTFRDRRAMVVFSVHRGVHTIPTRDLCIVTLPEIHWTTNRS
jgi:hypothetical protein